MRIGALSGSLTKLNNGNSYIVAGSNITVTSSSNGSVTISSTASGGGDVEAAYLVLSTTGSLVNERAFSPGVGLNSNDSGAGGNYTLSINDSIVATLSGSRFSGNVGIKTTDTASPLNISGSIDANATPTFELQGALIRIGDKLSAQTFSNGMGIKMVDSGVANYSIGQTGGNFIIAQTNNNGDQLFTSDRINLFNSTNAGLIAIGTTPTTARLFISGSSTGTDTSLLIRHGVAVGSNLPVLNVQNSAGTSLLFISGSGNVGIGTTSPASLLTVQGTTTIQGSESSTIGEPTATGRIRILDGGGLTNSNGGIEFKSADSGAGYGFRITNPDLGTGETPLFIQSRSGATVWTNRLTILAAGSSAGNIGIGGDFPRSRFEVTGSGATSATSAGHFVNSNGASLLFVRNDGNIGIGTSSPTGRLHISGSTTGTTATLLARHGIADGSNLSVLDIQNSAGTSLLRVSGSGVTTITGDLIVTNQTSLTSVKEKLNILSGATGTVTHDCSVGYIFYHSAPMANFTANFTNFTSSVGNGFATSMTLIISQSSPAYLPTAVQLDGNAQTINWLNSNIPIGNANKKDIVSFSVMGISSSYVVLGQLATFG